MEENIDEDHWRFENQQLFIHCSVSMNKKRAIQSKRGIASIHSQDLAKAHLLYAIARLCSAFSNSLDFFIWREIVHKQESDKKDGQKCVNDDVSNMDQ